MFYRMLAPAALAVLMISTGCSSHKQKKVVKVKEAFVMPMSQKGLDTVTATWPSHSKAAVRALTQKYGLPSSMTEEMVVWNNSSPFKRSIVYREEVTHKFPMQHADVLQQTIDYRIPLDKVAALSKFDGSLVVDRTKGEVAARGEREEMNLLAFNLADKIVREEITVEEGRREYLTGAQALQAGMSGPMLTGLNFRSQGTTSDPDTSMQSQQFHLETDRGMESGSRVRRNTKTETVEEVEE